MVNTKQLSVIRHDNVTFNIPVFMMHYKCMNMIIIESRRSALQVD